MEAQAVRPGAEKFAPDRTAYLMRDVFLKRGIRTQTRSGLSPGSAKKQATPEENAESLPLRKEEKSERKPSGFPFAFHHPPAGDGPPRGPNAKKGQQHNSVLLPFLVETGGLGSAG
jgi:hypothetical protein